MVRSPHAGWPLVVAGVLALLLVSLPGSADSPLGGSPLDLWGYAAVAVVAIGLLAVTVDQVISVAAIAALDAFNRMPAKQASAEAFDLRDRLRTA